MGNSTRSPLARTPCSALTRRRFIGLGLGGAGAGLAACKPQTSPSPGTRRSSGTFPQDAYVWQRLWTSAVASAVRAARGRMARLTLLAAEVIWEDGTPRLIRPQLDFPAITAFSGGCALAFRIGPFAGPFGERDAHSRQLVAWIHETLASARGGGWQPVELQIDFDAATSKLAGYRDWLAVFAKAVAPLPISFTALPDWLGSPTLREMAHLTGRYVLQVHAVERARLQDGRTASLIDIAQATRWVERAAEIGVPFQAALPTYRSAVGFDAEGKIVGIDSEGPARSWPPGTRLATYVSPAAELAQLIRTWTADRPAALQGVIWYRLPVEGDARNWTWTTLLPVMAGTPPQPKLEVTRAGTNPLDLALFNSGEAEAPWPEAITCRVSPASGRIVAADALAGYQLDFDPAAPGRATFRRDLRGAQQFLPPGGKKPLGWLRFNIDPNDPPDELAITIE